MLLFLDDATEIAEFTKILEPLMAGQAYTYGPRKNNEDNNNVGIAVTTKRDVAGYNFVRAGAIVTGVYAQDSHDRYQMRGRIRRVTQKRKQIFYYTVVPNNTILSLLFARHNTTDNKNASLKELAEEFAKKNTS